MTKRPNPEAVKVLRRNLQRFHVDDEAIFFAFLDIIDMKIPFTVDDAKK